MDKTYPKVPGMVRLGLLKQFQLQLQKTIFQLPQWGKNTNIWYLNIWYSSTTKWDSLTHPQSVGFSTQQPVCHPNLHWVNLQYTVPRGSELSLPGLCRPQVERPNAMGIDLHATWTSHAFGEFVGLAGCRKPVMYHPKAKRPKKTRSQFQWLQDSPKVSYQTDSPKYRYLAITSKSHQPPYTRPGDLKARPPS